MSRSGTPQDPHGRLERTLEIRRRHGAPTTRRSRSHLCEVCENAVVESGSMCAACRARMLAGVVGGGTAPRARADRGRQPQDLLSRVPGVVYRASPDQHRRLSFVTDAVAELTGFHAEEFTSGRVGLGRLIHPDDQSSVRAVLAGRNLTGGFELEYRILTASGEVRWVSDRGRRSSRSSPNWDEGLLIDVTEKRVSYEQLLHESRHDALTGVPNRRTLEVRLAEECARSERSGAPMTALIIDADHFKQVNDTHGHDAGDRVLVGLAERLHGAIRQYDILARFGGEEFVVVLLGANEPEGTMLAERLCRTVEATRIADLAVTVSIGGASWQPGVTPDELLKRADTALYAAKAAGRNRISVFADASPTDEVTAPH